MLHNVLAIEELLRFPKQILDYRGLGFVALGDDPFISEDCLELDLGKQLFGTCDRKSSRLQSYDFLERLVGVLMSQ